MNEITLPTQSVATLIKASVIAVIVAVLVSIIVIMPAEYNIDPTGLGRQLGLTQLAEPSPTKAAAPVKTATRFPDKTSESKLAYQENTVSVTVPAKTGVEYKFYLQQYGSMTYEWNTEDASALYFDFHGEPEGDTSGYFESFTIATLDKVKGSMTAPFNGSHGWYWKNTSDHPITLTLTTSGNYQVIGLKQ